MAEDETAPGAVTSWDLFDDLRTAQDELLRTNREYGQQPGTGPGAQAWTPPVDISERKDAYLVAVELPGVGTEDLEITFQDGLLTIQGERHPAHDPAAEKVYRAEGRYGAFRRSITLPSHVMADAIEATAHNGVLQILVPKATEVRASRIDVASQDPTEDGADQSSFVDSAEMGRQLVRTFPRLPRLVDAVVRRKRLLRAAASWRDHRKTQTDLAEAMGSKQPAVARLELGKVDPKLSTMERYAAALDANFLWQIVDDSGRPVSQDFTWEADVTYRRSNPGLAAETTNYLVHDVASPASSSKRQSEKKRG